MPAQLRLQQQLCGDARGAVDGHIGVVGHAHGIVAGGHVVVVQVDDHVHLLATAVGRLVAIHIHPSGGASRGEEEALAELPHAAVEQQALHHARLDAVERQREPAAAGLDQRAALLDDDGGPGGHVSHGLDNDGGVTAAGHVQHGGPGSRHGQGHRLGFTVGRGARGCVHLAALGSEREHGHARMAGREVRHGGACAVLDGALQAPAQPVAAQGLDGHVAFHAGHEVSALGHEVDHILALGPGDVDILAVVVAPHEHVARLGVALALEREVHGAAAHDAGVHLLVVECVAHVLDGDLRAGVAVGAGDVDVELWAAVAVLPGEPGVDAVAQREDAGHLDALLEEEVLAQALHKHGVGHERVVPLGQLAVEGDVARVHTLALDDLHASGDAVEGVAQLHVHVFALPHRLACGGVDDKGAQPHGVAAHVAGLVGGHVYFLLREVVLLHLEPGCDAVGRHRRGPQHGQHPRGQPCAKCDIAFSDSNHDKKTFKFKSYVIEGLFCVKIRLL